MFDNGTIAQYSYDVLNQLTRERRVTGAPKALAACGQIFSGNVTNAVNRDWTPIRSRLVSVGGLPPNASAEKLSTT
jgi:hypothetical protein